MGRVRKGVTAEATPEDTRFSAPQLHTALPGDARAPPAGYQSEAAQPLRASDAAGPSAYSMYYYVHAFLPA